MTKPTTLLYRNILAIEIEQLLRSLPCNGVVLFGSCNDTTSDLSMRLIGMNTPIIFAPLG
jgi:dihydroxyacid dehydratase/phosphogluconate dehydratase